MWASLGNFTRKIGIMLCISLDIHFQWDHIIPYKDRGGEARGPFKNRFIFSQDSGGSFKKVFGGCLEKHCSQKSACTMPLEMINGRPHRELFIDE